jgi:DNA-binding NarL/FixJ family response regulator
MMHGAGSSDAAAAASLELQESGWEELRREARKLEGDLDVKLSSYARLAARSSSSSPTADRSSWKSTELEIQALLDKLRHDQDSGADLFSERELEVLALLAQGDANKQIARRLALSENTVKFHLKNLYRKLEAGTREAALASALQRGLLQRAAAQDCALE